MAEIEEKEKEVKEQVDAAAAAAKAEAEAKGLSPEEVTAAVEKARKEEKDKLYPQIEELKNSMKEIQETLRQEREEKERIKKEADEKAEESRLKSLSESERTLEAIRKLEEKLDEERKEREESNHKLEALQRRRDLDTYRERALAAAGEELIPELVTGNTEAEIDRSIQIAKTRYEELATRFKTENGKRVRTALSSASPGHEGLEEEELEERLTPYDQDKYLQDPAYRKKIQDELAREYARSQGRV